MRSRPFLSDIFMGAQKPVEYGSHWGFIHAWGNLMWGVQIPTLVSTLLFYFPLFLPTKERLGSSAWPKANGRAVFNQYARIRPRTVLVYHRKCQGRAYTLPFVPKKVSSKRGALDPAIFLSNESKNQISRQRVTKNQTGAPWRMVRHVCRRELSD